MNRFVIHESAHQPVDDKRPGLGLGQYGQWFNRHETWAEQARAWTDYLARSCFMLQQGQNVADILYYYGEDDVITSLFAHNHPAIPFGYNFDYLNKDALVSLVSYDGRQFVTPSGSSYRVLIIDSHCQHMAPAVVEKLDALRQQGAPIVDLRQQTIADALHLLSPDVSASDTSELHYVHRHTTDADIYWISNNRHEARSIGVTFRISGLQPTLWHPETGQVEPLSYTMHDGLTTVSLDLTPDDAVFVVFQGKAEEQQLSLPVPQSSLLLSIDTPWMVEFLEPQGDNIGPGKPVVFPQLQSYSDSENPSVKYYSGTAVYRNTFQLPTTSKGKAARYILNLGQVGNLAEVSVNGQPLGTLWKEPYRIDISQALKAGKNELEVRVVNTWANRIIGDMQPDCQQKYTYTPDVFYRADSPLLPGGLLGPVEVWQVVEGK